MVERDVRRLLRQLDPFSESSLAGSRLQIHSIEHFRVALQRERARAKRSGYTFSVAVFEIGDPRGGEPIDSALLAVLVKRLRATDEIGWLDARRVGVLLYTTPDEGAWTFGKGVLRAVEDDVHSRTFAVYTYPDNWPEIADEGAPS